MAGLVDVWLCSKIPNPWVAGACMGIAFGYEWWTYHEINTANSIGGCLTVTAGATFGWSGVEPWLSVGVVNKWYWACQS
ncbi:hypothetical protein [Streptacidiphilus sp. EB129]|jgi:hypothetical protein|uniref:hypothetical protein n=1 Tax=Streptacidiphilus sp. EB129 TaxID=3156262 RepID=UPI0035123BD7